jgi:hypothetical protein
METELLGMPCSGTSLVFSKSLNETYRFLNIFRPRRLHLTSSIELRSWGFFGGSMDTRHDNGFMQFSLKIRILLTRYQFLNDI